MHDGLAVTAYLLFVIVAVIVGFIALSKDDNTLSY